MADPAASLASNSVLRTLFSPENSLFIHLRKKIIFPISYHYLVDIVNIKILSLDFLTVHLEFFLFRGMLLSMNLFSSYNQAG